MIKISEHNIYNGRIHNVRFSGNYVTSNCVKQEDDKLNIRPYEETVNERLKNVYGIKSDIKDKEILKCLYPAIEDFCKINKDDNLFKGLVLTQYNDRNKDIPYKYLYNCAEKSFILSFNAGFPWKDIADRTKECYNNAETGSDNPGYFMYKGLGDFLNFIYNPYAFRIHEYETPSKSVLLRMNRIGSIYNTNDYNSEYTATKMCKEYTPKILDEYYEDKTGNISLIFPESKRRAEAPKTEFDFTSTKEGEKYLYEKYGIISDFDNLKYINECTGAVKELCDAIGNDKIFEGLRIETAPDYFDDTTTTAVTITNSKTGEAKILINPATNIKNIAAVQQKQLDNGMHPTASVKNNIFIHELSHYLDFIGDPVTYGVTTSMGEDESEQTRAWQRISGRVSSYAAKTPREFCAEYIAGRMAGNKYPEITNNEFEMIWLGPKINFPD